jgi:hypothetical protein
MPSVNDIDAYFTGGATTSFVAGLINAIKVSSSSNDTSTFIKDCDNDLINNNISGGIVGDRNIKFIIPYFSNGIFIWDKPLPYIGFIALPPNNTNDIFHYSNGNNLISSISILTSGGGIKVTNSIRGEPTQWTQDDYFPGQTFQLIGQWYRFSIPITEGNLILLQAIAAPCLLKGTNILTPRGFLKIETLIEDDTILNHEKVPVQIRKISKMVITWSKSMPADHWVFKIPGPDPVFLTCWHKIRRPDGTFLEACYCELPWAWKEEYVEEDGTFTIYHIHVDDWANNHLIVNGGQVVESWSGVYSTRDR